MKVHDLTSRQLVLLAVLTCALIGALWAGHVSNEQRRVVDGFHSELPVPSVFSLVSHRSTANLGHATSSRYYRCSYSYQEIRSFYVTALEQRGWTYAGEHPIRDWGKSYGGYSLLFSRDDYMVTVQYAGAPDPPYGWDYAVSVSWE